MTTRRLTSDLLPDTSDWKLFVRVAPDTLSALLLGPEGVEQSVLAHSEVLVDAQLNTLENAIYDNPLLLADFAGVNLTIATSQLVQIPEATSPAVAEAIAAAMLPDSDAPRRMITAPMPEGSLLAMVDADTLNFLQRTFPDARISLSLSVTARRLNSIRPNDKASLYALCHHDELSVFAFDEQGHLKFANRFDTPSATDCAYYILAVAGTDFFEVSIGGNADLRNEVIEQIRLASPSTSLTPLNLPEKLMNLRRNAPELTEDLIFLTEL